MTATSRIAAIEPTFNDRAVAIRRALAMPYVPAWMIAAREARDTETRRAFAEALRVKMWSTVMTSDIVVYFTADGVSIGGAR